LDRREALRFLAVSSVLQTMPGRVCAAFGEIHAGLAATPGLKILDPHQDATVTALAELIIPQTETPGARAVRVNEFIDRIVADWYSDEDRTQFLTGLADVDRRTRSLFGKDFVDALPEQQSAIVGALGGEMAEEKKSLSAAPRAYRGEDPEPDGNFYYRFRDLTLTGYFTSEAGAIQQLHEEIIPGRYDGCVPSTPLSPQKGS
jgi:hypothetical protein